MAEPLDTLQVIASALRMSADTHWELGELQRRQTTTLRCLVWLIGLMIAVLLCAILSLLAVQAQLAQVQAQQTVLSQGLRRVPPPWLLPDRGTDMAILLRPQGPSSVTAPAPAADDVAPLPDVSVPAVSRRWDRLHQGIAARPGVPRHSAPGL
jgi:hypothetical protein